jgi:hypothetical protein
MKSKFQSPLRKFVRPAYYLLAFLSIDTLKKLYERMNSNPLYEAGMGLFLILFSASIYIIIYKLLLFFGQIFITKL